VTRTPLLEEAPGARPPAIPLSPRLGEASRRALQSQGETEKKEGEMAKYLVSGSYQKDGVKGLVKDGGSGRQASVTKMVEGLGGKIEAFYYAFGETDVFVVVDVPDAATAAALSMAVNASGAVRTTLTPLLTIEEVDAACKKTVSYTVPGA
jgi:uncharacterized protein with GYD domain